MREKRDLAIRAMQEALGRASGTRTAHGDDGTFAALAEALWWVCVLNESFWRQRVENGYEERRASDERGVVLEGLLYARNRMTHDIDITGMHGLIQGAKWPLRWPVSWGGWVWRGVNDLPEAPEGGRKFEDVYRRSLEGQKVEPTLRSAAAFLEDFHASGRGGSDSA